MAAATSSATATTGITSVPASGSDAPARTRSGARATAAAQPAASGRRARVAAVGELSSAASTTT